MPPIPLLSYCVVFFELYQFVSHNSAMYSPFNGRQDCLGVAYIEQLSPQPLGGGYILYLLYRIDFYHIIRNLSMSGNRV